MKRKKSERTSKFQTTELADRLSGCAQSAGVTVAMSKKKVGPTALSAVVGAGLLLLPADLPTPFVSGASAAFVTGNLATVTGTVPFYDVQWVDIPRLGGASGRDWYMTNYATRFNSMYVRNGQGWGLFVPNNSSNAIIASNYSVMNNRVLLYVENNASSTLTFGLGYLQGFGAGKPSLVGLGYIHKTAGNSPLTFTIKMQTSAIPDGGEIPEPSSLALLALGVAGLGTWRLRQKQQAEKAKTQAEANPQKEG